MVEDDFLEVISDFSWNGARGFWHDIAGDEPGDRILERLSEEKEDILALLEESEPPVEGIVLSGDRKAPYAFDKRGVLYFNGGQVYRLGVGRMLSVKSSFKGLGIQVKRSSKILLNMSLEDAKKAVEYLRPLIEDEKEAQVQRDLASAAKSRLGVVSGNEAWFQSDAVANSELRRLMDIAESYNQYEEIIEAINERKDDAIGVVKASWRSDGVLVLSEENICFLSLDKLNTFSLNRGDVLKVSIDDENVHIRTEEAVYDCELGDDVVERFGKNVADHYDVDRSDGASVISGFAERAKDALQSDESNEVDKNEESASDDVVQSDEDEGVSDLPSRQDLSDKIAYWKQKIVNTSKRNDLLKYRYTKTKSLRLEEPSPEALIDAIQEGESADVLRYEEYEDKDGQLVERDEPYRSPSSTQWLFNESNDTTEKKLYNVYLKDRRDKRETGVSTAYITVGELRYYESSQSEEELVAPLLLIPVTLDLEKSSRKEYHQITVSPMSEVNENHALRVLFEEDYGIDMPRLDLEEVSWDGIQAYFGEIGEVISGKTRWEIRPSSYLDIFFYQDQMMYEDLETHQEEIESSDLVQAFAGNHGALLGDINEEMRDDLEQPDLNEVLDADSSQKRAINMAKAGVSFVLEGPPGTGKSQTIVNIIAELLQQDKKVLFVSQKSAAIEVVMERLEEVGLDRYCLDLHGSRRKQDIIDELGHELENSPSIQGVDDLPRQKIEEAEQELNEYYAWLNKPRDPIRLSIYELRGKLADIDGTYYEDVLDQTLEESHETLLSLFDKVETIESILRDRPDAWQSPVLKIDESYNNALDRKELGEAANELQNLLGSLSEEETQLTREQYAELRAEVDEADDALLELSPERVPGLSQDTRITADRLHETITNAVDYLEENALTTFLDQDLADERETIKDTSFVTSFFNKEYKDARQTVNNYLTETASGSTILKCFRQRDQLTDAIDAIQSLNDAFNELFTEQDWEELQDDAATLRSILTINELSDDYDIPVTELTETVQHIGSNQADLTPHFDDVNEYFTEPILPEDADLDAVELRLVDMVDDLDHFQTIKDMQTNKEDLPDDVQELLAQCVEEQNLDMAASLQTTVYQEHLSRISREDYMEVPKQARQIVREEYADAQNAAVKKTMQQRNQQKPKHDFFQENSGETTFLRREVKKERNKASVRKLLREIPNLVFTLKPCFMMSPLSVSKYLGPDTEFDAVIFDEASQIMPEEAVPALYRSDQAVIMGDTEQLPPTTFFRKQDEADVDEEIRDLSSFLDEASINYRSETLRWHYRSEDEELITYSNHSFYDNKLITFPAKEKDRDDTGVRFHHVEDGVYDRGGSSTNRVEAERVVDRYFDIKEDGDESVGIVAFSKSQQRAIRDEFERRDSLDELEDDGLESTFVKNLETVQGDERDVILLSVCYGPDEDGKLSMNFGPLNRENGYKRLNVAVTRARKRTEVFSTIQYTDIPDKKINRKGLRHLKGYLEYAETKELPTVESTPDTLDFDSDFERAVYDRLTSEGFDVNTQIGSSGYRIDLGIVHPDHPGEYILGIECDGSQYHSSKKARDRDRVRQLVLESKGWDIHRIWSEDWIVNEDREVAEIEALVDELQNKDESSTSSAEKLDIEDEQTFQEVDLPEKLPVYPRIEDKQVADGLDYDEDGAIKSTQQRRALNRRIREIVRTATYIDIDFLSRKALKSFSITRLGNRSKKVVPRRLQNSRSIHVSHGTASCETIHNILMPRIPQDDMSLNLLPKQELLGGICLIIHENMSVGEDDLPRELARGVYGYKKTGSNLRESAMKATSFGQRIGLIVKEDGGYTLTEKGEQQTQKRIL